MVNGLDSSPERDSSDELSAEELAVLNLFQYSRAMPEFGKRRTIIIAKGEYGEVSPLTVAFAIVTFFKKQQETIEAELHSLGFVGKIWKLKEDFLRNHPECEAAKREAREVDAKRLREARLANRGELIRAFPTPAFPKPGFTPNPGSETAFAAAGDDTHTS